MTHQAPSRNISSERQAGEMLQSALSWAVSMVYFALFVLTALSTLILLTPLWLLSPLVDKDKRIIHSFYCRVLFGFMRLNPGWRLCINGLSNLKVDGPAVLVANHQSMADIVFISGLPLGFKWVAKNAIFQIPVVSCFMLMDGSVRIRSGALSGTRKMLRDCKSWLRAGVPVLLFPEGTRSSDGELLPFKDGPFQLAVECNLPVIPIVINGTREIWPKYAHRLRFTGKVEMSILTAVHPSNLDGDVRRLKAHVENLMSTTLSEMRRTERVGGAEGDCMGINQLGTRPSAKRAARLN